MLFGFGIANGPLPPIPPPLLGLGADKTAGATTTAAAAVPVLLVASASRLFHSGARRRVRLGGADHRAVGYEPQSAGLPVSRLQRWQFSANDRPG